MQDPELINYLKKYENKLIPNRSQLIKDVMGKYNCEKAKLSHTHGLILHYIPKLISIANKSTIIHRHSSLLLKGGKPMAYGYNKIISNLSRHAELDVIVNFLSIYNISFTYKELNQINNNIAIPSKKLSCIRNLLRKTTIIVIRVTSNFVLSDSCPCEQCANMLKVLKVQKIIYSCTEAPKFKYIKVKCL